MTDVDPKKPLILGVIGGLIGIYLVPIVPIIGPLFGALGAVAAIIWGADAIARVASYGLGTGVPSIGYMSLGIAVIGALAGIAGAIVFGGNGVWFGPIFGFILAMIIGAVVSVVGINVIHMKIPVLIRCTIELSGAAALSVIGFSAAIAGSITMSAIVVSVINTGFIGLLFIMNTMAIQHPFNACLGPQENRVRTLKLAGVTGFISMAIVGILAMGTTSVWWVISIIGAIGWYISISSFVKASKDEAASVKWTGWWPKEDEV